MTTPAHDQNITHHYMMHYPEHEPRTNDPHYKDFNHYRRTTAATAKCQFGLDRDNDFSECGPINPNLWPQGLELHHGHIEFALLNGVDLSLLEGKYPGISDPNQLGAWIESAENLMWLCEFHHRGTGGVHSATASDYENEHYVRHLIS
jgi:hypothetical protein